MGGVTGVTVFFVISGFLITTLLLKEEAKTGRISLSGFYRRRAFRILPAAFAYLAVALVFALQAGLPWKPVEWIGAALFFRNLVTGDAGSHLTGHFWSLSIEEQFYLFWPVLVVWLPRSKRLWITLGMCLFAPVWRHLMVKLAGGGPLNIGRIDLNYDSLLVGALLALLQDGKRFRGLFDQLPIAGLVLALAVVGFFAQLVIGPPFGLIGRVAGPSVQLVLIATVIKVLVEGRCRPLQVICGFPPVVWLGRLSYSLYLWQSMFCELRFDHPLWRIPWCLGGTLFCAVVSYYLVEQPMLRLRDQRRTA